MTQRFRFESLDALRGVAALFVAAVHFPAIFWGSQFGPLRHSFLLTNLFFALSGFIIMAAYGEKLGTWAQSGRFIKARLKRLVPLHAVTSITILAVPYIAYASNWALTWIFAGKYVDTLPSFPINWEHYMVHVLMLQGFNLLPALVYNFPAWSMGAIFFCSTLLALLSTIARPIRVPLFALIAAGALAVLAFESPTYNGSSHDFGIFRALMSYFAGSLTFVAWKKLPVSDDLRKWTVLWQTLALGLLFAYATWVGVDSPRSLWAPAVMAVFMWAFAFDEGDYARFLRHPAFKWLSKRSYSIFMNQAALLFIGHQAFDWIRYFKLNALSGLAVGTVALFVYLGLLLAISNWTHKHIELRFSEKKKSSTKPVLARAVAA